MLPKKGYITNSYLLVLEDALYTIYTLNCQF